MCWGRFRITFEPTQALSPCVHRAVASRQCVLAQGLGSSADQGHRRPERAKGNGERSCRCGLRSARVGGPTGVRRARDPRHHQRGCVLARAACSCACTTTRDRTGALSGAGRRHPEIRLFLVLKNRDFGFAKIRDEQEMKAPAPERWRRRLILRDVAHNSLKINRLTQITSASEMSWLTA